MRPGDKHLSSKVLGNFDYVACIRECSFKIEQCCTFVKVNVTRGNNSNAFNVA